MLSSSPISELWQFRMTTAKILPIRKTTVNAAKRKIARKIVKEIDVP